MADSMMRVAGRDIVSGTAKAIQTDSDGRLYIKTLGADAESGDLGNPFSYVVDTDGIPVLRIVDAAPHHMNGEEIAVFANTGATAAQFAELENTFYRGVLIRLRVTSAGSDYISLRTYFPDFFDKGNEVWRVLKSFTAVTESGGYAYVLYPSSFTAGGEITEAYNMILPRRWRIGVTHGGATNWSYSVNINYLL